VNERSDLNDKLLCDRIIRAQVPLFQEILIGFWRKSSGVWENYLTSFTDSGKISRRRILLQILTRVSNAMTVILVVLGLFAPLGGQLTHHSIRAVIVAISSFSSSSNDISTLSLLPFQRSNLRRNLEKANKKDRRLGLTG
jgi:hypothetical protein